MIYTIYGIHHIDKEDDILYIGSTNNLDKRIYMHKFFSKNQNNKYYNCDLYNHVRTHNKLWDEFNFKILEILECDRKKEALDCEKKYILQLKTNEKYNKQIPTNFINAGSNKSYMKKWNQEHKEYFQNYYQEKTKNNIYICNCCNYRCNVSHKSRHLKTKKHINNEKVFKIDEILERI